ncbi:hypothetical protein [Metabacillus litoralis]|uniref:hypothetical protein n=1 Tax=Metabacillus litoralis TaxID=152268 RepID=UPI00203C2268|nr:hypothetical protein [Metabacillus litoralis]MCM3651348.1 hypothetical protein [Metabacillus litoralis]
MDNNWYSIIDHTENISQGDILFNCPLFVPIYPNGDLSAKDFETIEKNKLTTEVKRANVIVLNQACDLEVRPGQVQPKKLESVLVAALQDVRITEVGKNSLKPIAKLEKTELFLLDPSFNAIQMGYQIVHFNYLYSLPWKLLNTFSKTRGKRLRLNSPYLEQLSQHLGNNFGRVAIPENREDFINDFYSIHQVYETKRKSGEYTKLWKDLTEDEVQKFIMESTNKK